jgi:hypothetical protein
MPSKRRPLITRSFLEQPTSVIEGIGEQRTAALGNAGIETLADLLAAGPDRIQRAVSGAGARQVSDWLAAALLLRVSGMTPDVAEALVDGGIRSVRRLSEAGLQTLERALAQAVEAGKVDKAPSLYRLAEYGRDAAWVRDRGFLAVRTLDRSTGEPIAGAAVWGLRRSTLTDARGVFVFHPADAGLARFTIEPPGHRLASFAVQVRPGVLTAPTVRLRLHAARRRAPAEIREADGHLVRHSVATTSRVVTRRLDELPDGIHLVLRRLDRSGTAHLVSLYKTRIGTVVNTERVEIGDAALPAGAAVGDVLELSGGALSRTQLSTGDVAKLKLQRALGLAPAGRAAAVLHR